MVKLKRISSTGGDLRRSKYFENAVHEPLFFPDEPKLVLELIPPMELHLLLGVVNHLFKGLTKLYPGAAEWPLKLHIKMEDYHGGEFVGNDCRKLLKNVNILNELLEDENLIELKCFSKAFETFKEVVDGCFGSTICSNIFQKIENFKEAYLTTKVSITPKAHAIFHHVPEFLEMKGCGLGVYSEQSTETLHSDFKSQWSRFKIIKGHPKYEENLFNCVVDYNSKHM